MHGESAAVVDQLVPHAQAALFGFTEVVGVEHAGDLVVEVDGNQPVVGKTVGFEIGCVDDLQLGLEVLQLAFGRCKVQLLLHRRDVSVGFFDH